VTRRVRTGEPFAPTAAEYNAILDAAEAFKRNRLDGGKPNVAPVHRDAGIVRVVNNSGSDVLLGGALAIDDTVADPTVGEIELARFARDMTFSAITPNVDRHVGQVAVAIEPIPAGRVGRVVVDGIVAARVNVIATWHTFADISPGSVAGLRSLPTGSADILYRRSPNDTGTQWCVVRLGNTLPTAWLIQPPAAGVPGMIADTPGYSAACKLYRLGTSGAAEPVVNAVAEHVTVPVLNLSPQRIAPPPTIDRLQLVPVSHDARTDRWITRPPRHTVVCVPLATIEPDESGSCRELRWTGAEWSDSSDIIAVRNACAFAWSTGDRVVANWHDDAGYLGQACKCCDDSGAAP